MIKPDPVHNTIKSITILTAKQNQSKQSKKKQEISIKISKLYLDNKILFAISYTLWYNIHVAKKRCIIAHGGVKL